MRRTRDMLIKLARDLGYDPGVNYWVTNDTGTMAYFNIAIHTLLENAGIELEYKGAHPAHYEVVKKKKKKSSRR